MITLQSAGFGDFRTDLVNGLTIVMGRDKATQTVTGFEDLIKQRAKEGAEASIPLITAEVEKRATRVVKPLAAVAAAMSAAASILATVAIIKAGKR